MSSKKAALCLMGVLVSTPVLAGPSDYVYTPHVEYGEKEIDLKFGSARMPEGDRQQAASLGFGYGATENWFTEVYLKYEREGGGGTFLNALEWENKFQLTEPGQYAVDVGLITELEIPYRNGGAYEFKFGPLFQKDLGKLQLNGNLLFERRFGGNLEVDDEPRRTEMGYQWQVKYRWRPAFEFGMQGFGEMGEWNHWDARDEQNHRFGPAAFGKIVTAGHHAFKYNAAWLFGASKAAPDHTFRMQMEYEF